MPESFEEIASLYTNIISEAKGRLMIVEKVLSQPEPTGVLDYVAASDLCSLLRSCVVLADPPDRSRATHPQDERISL